MKTQFLKPLIHSKALICSIVTNVSQNPQHVTVTVSVTVFPSPAPETCCSKNL